MRRCAPHCESLKRTESSAMSEPNVTVEKTPSGKWGCFLHLPHHPAPIFLGKEFKTEERAENWLTVSEADTAIDMMTTKYAQK